MAGQSVKRTQLRRKTPLARGAPLKRTAFKPKTSSRRPPGDFVDGRLHADVINREGMCFGILIRMHPARGDLPAPPWHQCRDKWGGEHSATDLTKLVTDHVWRDTERAVGTGAYGDRAPSSMRNLVATCHALNDHGMTKLMRQLERRYLEWWEARQPKTS
jgi:hypothetical protein